MNLSMREKEVVDLVVQGHSNKDIGDKLFITEKTIKFHLTKIYEKLGLQSRAQLIVMHLKDQVSPADLAEFKKLL